LCISWDALGVNNVPNVAANNKITYVEADNETPHIQAHQDAEANKKTHGTDSVIPEVGMIQFSYHDQHKRTQSIHNSLHVVEFYLVVSTMYCV
jgi:hypothetical protein